MGGGKVSVYGVEKEKGRCLWEEGRRKVHVHGTKGKGINACMGGGEGYTFMGRGKEEGNCLWEDRVEN